MNYTVTKNNKTLALVLMALGAISIVLGFADGDMHRGWSNLLLGNFFVLAIALGGVFFLCVQYAAEVGWSAQLVRIFMAFGSYIPFAGIFMLLIFFLGKEYLYHWTHHDLYDPSSPEYDKIMVGKSAYLNIPFFVTRMVAYFAIWWGLAFLIKRRSLQEDLDGELKHHKKMMRLASTFLVLFAITSSMSAWDFIMSIDSHWYSTLFGWYTFAGLFISGLSVMTFLVVYLKKQGYLPNVTENHIHDMGKFMFAFSVFWTYLWFAQFMLIWYANIPEEITYFLQRFDHYRFLFILTFFINFCAPILLLMSRDAKRKMVMLQVVALLLICGHWLDNYLMIMPGSQEEQHLGIPEIGTTFFFIGLFIWVLLHSLAKHPIIAKNHPMLGESLHHHI